MGDTGRLACRGGQRHLDRAVDAPGGVAPAVAAALARNAGTRTPHEALLPDQGDRRTSPRRRRMGGRPAAGRRGGARGSRASCPMHPRRRGSLVPGEPPPARRRHGNLAALLRRGHPCPGRPRHRRAACAAGKPPAANGATRSPAVAPGSGGQLSGVRISGHQLRVPRCQLVPGGQPLGAHPPALRQLRPRLVRSALIRLHARAVDLRGRARHGCAPRARALLARCTPVSWTARRSSPRRHRDSTRPRLPGGRRAAHLA